MQTIQGFINESLTLQDNQTTYKTFLSSHIGFLQQITSNKQTLILDSTVILDYIEEIRWVYFMTSGSDIDPLFQSLCKIAIKTIIKTKWIWVENYLRYFPENNPYRLRMEALCAFRLLANPKDQIVSAFQTVLTKLHQSLSQDAWSLSYAREIFKEYIDKLFAVVHTTPDQRSKRYTTFISTIQEESLIRTQDQELTSWLENYDTISAYKTSPQISEVVTATNESSTTTSEIYLEDIEWYKNEIKELTNKLLNQKQQIQQLNDENTLLKNQLASYSNPIEYKQEITHTLQSSIDRSSYRIDIIWWSPKVMKKYKDIQKSIDLRPWWIDRKQFEVICDYEWQKKLKIKDIENKLLMGNTDMILAIQTDHETELANLIKKWTFADQITVFAEDQAFTWQSLSNERFIHYLNLALEKYERVERNLF